MENFKEAKTRENIIDRKQKYLTVAVSLCLLISLFVFFSVQAASAAGLSLSPASGEYQVGKTFSVNVFVTSPDQAMNAAGGVISFSADKIEVTSLSKSGSIFSLWVQEPSFSNPPTGGQGTINFEGIVMNPGFTGASGKIITINFKAKTEGSAALTFASGSILANDGIGTNILSSLGSAKFNITLPASAPAEPAVKEEPAPSTKETNTPAAPTVFSSTHPDQAKWYANNNPEFSWELPAGVNGLSTYLSQSPASNPGQVSDGFFSSKSYKNVDDGAWYFHVRLRNGYGWGGISHYRFQIDTAPPAPFTIQFVDGRVTDQPQIRMVFNTTDSLSGIDHYTIEYGNNNSLRVTPAEMSADNSYTLRLLPLGRQSIKITAFDQAGNSAVTSDEFTAQPVVAPEIIDFPSELAAGETLKVMGKTVYLNAGVNIWLQEDLAEPEKYSSVSDGEGRFTFDKKEIAKGAYQLWAEVVDEAGNRSNSSNKAVITVKESAFSGLESKLYEAGVWTIGFLTILIPLLALLLLLLLLIRYSWKKFTKLKIKAAKEIREARKALEQELVKSKKDIQKHIEILEANRARRKLVDEAEIKIIDRLKKDLAAKENLTKKEIKDIEITGE